MSEVIETQHSAGTWSLDRYEDHEDGGGEDWFRLSADSTLFVNIRPCSDGYVPGQNEANAYLLWAAPDLLAACQEVVAWLTPRIGSAATETCLPAVHAAILKATGKGPVV